MGGGSYCSCSCRTKQKLKLCLKGPTATLTAILDTQVVFEDSTTSLFFLLMCPLWFPCNYTVYSQLANVLLLFRRCKKKKKQKYWILRTVYFRCEVCDSTKKRIIIHFLQQIVCVYWIQWYFRQNSPFLLHWLASGWTNLQWWDCNAALSVYSLQTGEKREVHCVEICQSFPARLSSNPLELETGASG